MTSDDYFQLTTALNRLRQLKEIVDTLTDPVRLVNEVRGLVQDFFALFDGVPGDPDAIEDLATACRVMANALASADTDLDHVRRTVPGVWQGDAAQEAVSALQATQSLMEQGIPAMRRSANLLDDYAEELRTQISEYDGHRQALRDVLSELDSLGDWAGNIWDTVNPFDDDGGLTELPGRAASAIAGLIRVFEKLESAQDTLCRGMRDVTGKARAGAVRSPHLSAFAEVMLADAGIDGSAREENGILSTAQLQRAADLLGELPADEREQMLALLDGADSPVERAYLLKALAAGHPVDSISDFGALIQGKDDAWLRRHLSLIDPEAGGRVLFNGVEVDQYNGRTCGSTSIMLALAMNDPLYALSLTTDNGVPLSGDEFEDRLAEEEQRIHDRTATSPLDPGNYSDPERVWPQEIGTSPWALADELNDHSGATGTNYDWRFVDDTDSGSVNPALDDAVGAADAGHPVPVLIGDSYPAHYVLLVGHEGDELIFYDPSGEMVRVSESDFRDGNMSAMGYDHVQGVITPQ